MSCIIYKDGEKGMCEALELPAMLSDGWSVDNSPAKKEQKTEEKAQSSKPKKAKEKG